MPAWALLLGAVVAVIGGRYLLDMARQPSSGVDSARPDEASRGLVSDYGRPHIVGRLQAPGLGELSGLAASRRNPGLLWAHNDSGDGPLLYCLTPSGAACGLWEVEGAEAVDWEDIAAAPSERGAESLYIADIGDNDRSRETITIYRVPEPKVAPAQEGTARSPSGTLDAEAFTLTYPDDAHDAEAMIVNRETGDLYVITKEYSSRSHVFVARAPLRDRQQLEPVAAMRIVGVLAARTGASLSPDGERIVFSTYDKGYELRLPEGRPFDSIWNQQPVPVELGSHEQGEAVTYSITGDAIVSASEGAGSPIYSVERRD